MGGGDQQTGVTQNISPQMGRAWSRIMVFIAEKKADSQF